MENDMLPHHQFSLLLFPLGCEPCEAIVNIKMGDLFKTPTKSECHFGLAWPAKSRHRLRSGLKVVWRFRMSRPLTIDTLKFPTA